MVALSPISLKAFETVGNIVNSAKQDKSFGDVLKNNLLDSPMESLKKAEDISIKATTDKTIDKMSVVSLITEAEIELQKLTTTLSKATEAYNSILHMPL